MYSHLFSCRGNGLSSFYQLAVSHKLWKWVVGDFSMGCGQLIYNHKWCAPRQSAGQWNSSIQAVWSAQNLLRDLNRCHSQRKCSSSKESVIVSVLNLTGFNNKLLPNLQHLLACCIPIERHLKKICQNYISGSWALLDTWPKWCELNSQKIHPRAPQNLCFLTIPRDGPENNFHCLQKNWDNAISTPAAFLPVSEHVYVGIARWFFEHQTCIN